MKTAASYIKKKYDCYKNYSEKSIRDVCHIWCEVIEEAQNDVKKEYEEKNRWVPVEEKLPETYSIILATIKSPECIWVEEIGFGEGKFQLPGRGDTSFVTHWMYVPEPPSFL